MVGQGAIEEPCPVHFCAITFPRSGTILEVGDITYQSLQSDVDVPSVMSDAISTRRNFDRRTAYNLSPSYTANP